MKHCIFKVVLFYKAVNGVLNRMLSLVGIRFLKLHLFFLQFIIPVGKANEVCDQICQANIYLLFSLPKTTI